MLYNGEVKLLSTSTPVAADSVVGKGRKERSGTYLHLTLLCHKSLLYRYRFLGVFFMIAVRVGLKKTTHKYCLDDIVTFFLLLGTTWRFVYFRSTTNCPVVFFLSELSLLAEGCCSMLWNYRINWIIDASRYSGFKKAVSCFFFLQKSSLCIFVDTPFRPLDHCLIREVTLGRGLLFVFSNSSSEEPLIGHPPLELDQPDYCSCSFET